MPVRELLEELRLLGNENHRKTWVRHGIPQPFFGVPVSELQKIRKRIKRDYQLALDLYDTGNYDARYLAGLIADDARMTKKDLQHWAEQANCGALVGSTVPWVAAESPHGAELARKWTESKKELIAAAGWATWISLVSIKPDAELDLAELARLLARVEREIHGAPNLVRSQMNHFVIALGSFVAPLTATALEAAGRIGPVSVDVGDTYCQVPDATAYIRKVEARGSLGKKRKTAKC